MIRPQKGLVLFTFISLLLISGGVIALTRPSSNHVVIKEEKRPTLGNENAKVHVVILEEPKCSSCKEYSDTIFPKIRKEYIDKGLISYSMILVSFLPGSAPAGNALFCVYNHSDSEQFFKYLDYIYLNQPDESVDWAKTPLLVDFAKKAGIDIDPSELQRCIESDQYRFKLDENTQYGQTLMKGHLATPAIFVNGEMVNELSYDAISDLIDKKLEAK